MSAGDHPLKSRILLSLLALVGLASFGSAAPAPVYREPPKPKIPDVYALMQGTWEMDLNFNNLVRVGKAIRRSNNKQVRIQGTSWEYSINNNGVQIDSAQYQIVLDPKASPATLDLMGLAPDGGMKGIVKVEGDTLTFCHVYDSQQNAERPKQFFAGTKVMPNGTQMMTMTLKRVK